MSAPVQRPGAELDLRKCAEEPIQYPGAIQPHGALISVSEPGLRIDHASGNLSHFLGLEPDDALGAGLDAKLPADAVNVIRAALTTAPPAGQNFATYDLPHPTGRVPLAFTVHRHDGQVLIEVERQGPPGPAVGDLGKVERSFEAELAELGNSYEVARRAAEAVAEVSRFDRVMIYRFLPDWSGEVIAEVRRPTATAFLGLRFPATDIPEQARHLYRVNRLRVIPDVDGVPVPILPPRNPVTQRRLDLSFAGLRAVSPIHLQYLRNMGVAATVVASLIVAGRLWGLIACHHDRARAVDPAIRACIAELAKITGAVLTRVEEARLVEAERRIARYLAVIERSTPGSGNLIQTLICGDPNLLDLANADGIAIRAGTALVTVGQTPPPALIERLVVRMAADTRDSGGDKFLMVDSLRDLDPGAEQCQEAAAGMMAAGLPHQPGVVLAAFRRELVEEVVWGGDPAKAHELKNETLTPRKSFSQWRETVTGRCRPWEPEAEAAWRALPAWLASAFGTYTMAGERLNADLIALRITPRLDDPLMRALLNLGAGTVLTAASREDPGAKVIAVNREFRRLFDVVPDQFIGRTVGELMAILGMVDTTPAAVGPGKVVEVAVLSPDVGQRVIAIRHRPFLHYRSPRTEIALSAWVFEDVTGPRRVEQALKSARDQALVASRAKTAFLATMSHELRTPLNAIIGFSEIMRAELFGSLGSARYKEYIRHIETSGEHLLKVIGDILDLSKVEAGKYVLEEQTIDMQAMIEDICQVESSQAERAGVTLMEDPAPVPLTLQGDERAIKQMLLNLLSNSFKFTPAGGMVTCRSLMLPDGAIAIEVQDSGIGIPDEFIHRVLDPYVQAPRPGPVRRDGSGTGLGLSVVRVLAEIHDARITVRSQPGRGTILRITFPAWRTVNRVMG